MSLESLKARLEAHYQKANRELMRTEHRAMKSAGSVLDAAVASAELRGAKAGLRVAIEEVVREMEADLFGGDA